MTWFGILFIKQNYPIHDLWLFHSNYVTIYFICHSQTFFSIISNSWVRNDHEDNFVLIAYAMRWFTRPISRFMIIYRWITLSNCALITQMKSSSNYSTTQCLFLNRQVWQTYFNILFSRKTLMSSCALIWPMKNFNNFSTIKCLSLNRLTFPPPPTHFQCPRQNAKIFISKKYPQSDSDGS